VSSAVVASQAPWLVKVGASRLKASSVPVGSRLARFAVDVSAWYRGDDGGGADCPCFLLLLFGDQLLFCQCLVLLLLSRGNRSRGRPLPDGGGRSGRHHLLRSDADDRNGPIEVVLFIYSPT
jgi:hypothetical protein